ncbi:hypothetical protein BU16DRAFT_480196 [Lophium mytilinum]|uniref:Eisosome protein 1 n=1 Tax=Lophium mytilinum TaxID=390894 RepID=A0A6A6R7I1_9PEZI|nr:hypothetical protein BU16DRAFT_480196 [Lophium mytilinum]
MATQTQTSNDASKAPLPGDHHSHSQANGAGPDMKCPDPSAHSTKGSALQNQASNAALYATHPERGSNPRESKGSLLDSNGKLSSASAATSLKHARPQDLPSFPIVGIDTLASAGAAATLANANTKSPEWWKPDSSDAAGKAAFLAKDYKMAPLWQPEASAAGSKAALLAANRGGKVDLWMPEASADGNSAANIAMRTKGLSPELDRGYTKDGSKRAMMAATGAVSESARRKRAGSTPAPLPSYPDSANSARNALSAATLAHRPSTKAAPLGSSKGMGSPAMEAARIQHNKSIPRSMYTEHPPIRMETDEANHQNALRASAISMAKQMYNIQQKHIDDAKAGRAASHGQSAAAFAHGQTPTTTDGDVKEQAMQFIHVQEAAQRLAAERLARIPVDNEAAYRNYYGYENKQRSKLSMRGRRRAASDPEEADSDDEFRARRIRAQTSQFSNTVAQVDAKKRTQDRQNLMAAAERKVKAQMLGMDDKVFNETGKMSPAMMEDWENKARAKAAADSEARMVNHGRVHVGGGKFMDQSEIDAVAAARIQPTLDEINDATEKQRARDEEIRLDNEEKKRQTRTEKERSAGLKAEEKRAKGEEKAAARSEKEAEKAKRAEEKRIQKEEKRNSRDAPKTIEPETPTTAATAPVIGAEEADADLYEPPTPVEAPTAAPEAPETAQRKSVAEEEATSPTSPTSPVSPTKSDSKGLKGIFSKFKSRRSKHEPGKLSFSGGSALTGARSKEQATTASATQHEGVSTPTRARSPSISSLSSDDGEAATRGRQRPARTTSGISGVSGVSREEEFEEARDTFDDGLVPPPTFESEAGAAARKGSPNRDSKFQEIL